MSELKITVDQLKNYLGTELKVTFDGDEYEHEFVGIDLCNEGIHLISTFNDFGRSSIKNVRPICYRLSDLDKEIEHNGERFVPLYELIREFNFHKDDIDTFGLHTIPFGAIQDLLKWHFWPFGDSFFDEGLVIDKMKIQNG